MKAAARRVVTLADYKIGAKERRYVARVLASNRLSYGDFTRRFEAAFAKAHQCKFGLFCNSGTSALQVALQALKEEGGWSDGDEVLVPAVTFVATANIVLHNRMTPVFVDVDARTYDIDPKLIEDKITPRTRAIIPVHLLGLAADMDPIREIAARRGLKIIEDSCEDLFGTYKGKKVGSMSDVGCFSTHVSHYIVTGVGGLCTTSDQKLAIHIRSLYNHGRDSIYFQIDDDRDVAGEKLHEIAARRFSFVSVGHSFRATELEAAIGLAQMPDARKIVAARQRYARLLTRGLKGLEDELQLPYIPKDQDHVFMFYPLVLKNQPKTGLVNFLEDAGVETRDLMPMISQPVYRKMYGDLEPRYPVARGINRHGLIIGCHQYLGEKDAEHVIGRVRAYFSR